MVRSLWFAALGLISVGAAAQVRQLVPTAYEAGHFYATPQTRDGQSLRLLVDTGGGGGSGFFLIDPAAATRLGLRTFSCDLGDEQAAVIGPVAYRPGKSLPPPLHTPCGAAALVAKGIGEATFGDGVLGAGYLPGRIWTFNYPKRQLWVESVGWKPVAASRRVPLGFVLNQRGRLATGMARITVRIEGQPVDLLLDTGATAKPTAAGEQASRTPTHDGIGVTSYITRSTLERWHREHPDWRVVKNGDDLFNHARLIEVPQVELAGWNIGPVWFTERTDPNFSETGMSQYMDQPVVGALGANVFRHFVMTIDYPKRAAWFDCIKGCRAAGKP